MNRNRGLGHTVTCLAVAVVAVGISVGLFVSGASAGDHVLSLIEQPTGTASNSALAPAVRIDAPARVMIDAPAAPAANRSTCRTDLPSPVMTITISDIAYVCPVYAGDQTVLDSGAATMITDPSIASALATHPGGAGTIWIAGHRVSHGGPFADVPTLSLGAIVTVADGASSASYRVVGRAYFAIRNNQVVDASGNATGEATLDSILRPDHGDNGTPRLLIQTCDGPDHRWMIYADLVTG